MDVTQFAHSTVSDSQSFFDEVDRLLNQAGYRWVVHIEWLDNRLCYYFIHPERVEPYLLNVELLSVHDHWPSLSHFFRALEATESNISKMGGPHFQQGSWTPRYQWRTDSELPALRNKLLGQDFRSNASLGPVENKWAHTMGVNDLFAGFFSFHLEGEGLEVTRAQLIRGHFKTNWCARAQEYNWRQLINQTDSLSPGTPYFANLALIESLEDQLDVALPERASAIRMILCELSRIYDHLQSLHSLFLLQGVSAWEKVFLDLGIQVYQLIKRYGRGEWTGHLNTIGGVRYDLPDDWKNQLLSLLSVVMKNLDGARSTIERSPGLISMLSRVHLGLRDVMDHTLTGPLARACGLRRDLRKINSRYFYHEVDFDIPLGINSTFYDVVLVKIEEMRQSVSILAQLLDGLPFDSIQTPEYSLFWNTPEYSLLSSEERSEVLARLKGGPQVPGERGMGMVESSRGEFSLIWQAQTTSGPTQLSVISPSLQASYFVEKRAISLAVSEVYAMCALAHIAPEEMDL